MNNKITIYLYDDEYGRVQLIQHWGDDKMVVNAARVSFGQDNEKSLDERDKKLINYLVKHKHTSTLEHCGLTFKFVVPMFVARQHMRHRTWSFNEISRRYTDVNIQFYEPKQFRKQSKSNRQASINEIFNPYLNDMLEPASKIIKEHHEASLYVYNKLLGTGICREQARGVLPQNMYCEYYGTANLNNLFKFINLRTHDGAQWEIQKVAEACLNIAKDLFPTTMQSYMNTKKE